PEELGRVVFLCLELAEPVAVQLDEFLGLIVDLRAAQERASHLLGEGVIRPGEVVSWRPVGGLAQGRQQGSVPGVIGQRADRAVLVCLARSPELVEVTVTRKTTVLGELRPAA